MDENISNLINKIEGDQVNKKYFLGHNTISIGSKDYQFRGIVKNKHDSPKGILFDYHSTNYGIVLEAPKRNKLLDVAVLGFNINDNIIDCLQIQGGRGRYRELTPLQWDSALLDKTIQLGRKASCQAI